MGGADNSRAADCRPFGRVGVEVDPAEGGERRCQRGLGAGDEDDPGKALSGFTEKRLGDEE
jgi:hypothetical protein